MRAVQNKQEDKFANSQDSIEAAAIKLCKDYPTKAKEMLTDYGVRMAEETFSAWKNLGEVLLVKYNDGARIDHKTGRVKRVYPSEDYAKEVLKATGERYLVPKK